MRPAPRPPSHKPREPRERGTTQERGANPQEPPARNDVAPDTVRVMPVQLFTFVQMELPWELGPADGRYLLRKATGPDAHEPQHVVVLGTVGAERRGLLGGRSRTRRTDPEPARVPIARATIIDPVPLSVDSQARKWLDQLDPEHEARTAAGVLNRVLFAQRIAGAAPHIHEVSATQALIVRAGYGEGEQVADGLWRDARELVLSRRRTGRRESVLRPQERLAVLLSGRDEVLLCEELALRARLDLDAGRLALATVELDRAYAAALAELPAEERDDLRERIDELERLRPGVEEAGKATVTRSTAGGGRSLPRAANGKDGEVSRSPDRQMASLALERLEAALRARTASGLEKMR